LIYDGEDMIVTPIKEELVIAAKWERSYFMLGQQ
jgi:hypothetical protein